jgi:hypothetical protein
MENLADSKDLRPKRYWASRPDRDNLGLFYQELLKGNLRQGWGYKEDLSLDQTFSEVAKGGEWWLRLTKEQLDAHRNYPFHPKAKPECFVKGDIVLIPNMPDFGFFSLAEVADDQYHYEIIPGCSDYRHLRKVKLLTPHGISNHHPEVHADIKSSLRCRSRIWRLDHLGLELEKLIALLAAGNFDDQVKSSSLERYTLIESASRRAAREPARAAARQQVIQLIDASFHASEFEVAIKCVLEKAFPGAIVTCEAGQVEALHGTDLLVRIENPFDRDSPFLIPVQVKKHQGVSSDGIAQLRKAWEYWKDKGQVIGLGLVNTAVLADETKHDLTLLKQETCVTCYHIDRDQVIELFVSAVLGDWVMD